MKQLVTTVAHPNHSHRVVGFIITAKRRVIINGFSSYFYVGRSMAKTVVHIFYRPGVHKFQTLPGQQTLRAEVGWCSVLQLWR